MASITEEFSGECFDFDRLPESRLGVIVLKREQKEAVANLMEGKYVLAVLPTGFNIPTKMKIVSFNAINQKQKTTCNPFSKF